MNTLIFDVETTGLPVSWNAPVTNVGNWPRVIQIAWQVYDPEENLIKEKEYLIKPDGWVIPKEKFWIDNGFSTEKNMAEGIPILEALHDFVKDLQDCSVIVSHNMQFDYSCVGAEMVRKNLKSENKPKKICTKVSGTDYCKIPSLNPRFNDFKWPNLQELHFKLFGKDFDGGSHDALEDVKCCAKCYFAMKKIEGIFEDF